MPVTFILCEDQKSILTTAVGILGREAILEHIRAKAVAGVLAYPELFDARDATLDLSGSDLQRIADEVKIAMGTIPPGKIAVVTNNNFIFGIASTYKELTAQQNPKFEVFRHLEEARSWISEDSGA